MQDQLEEKVRLALEEMRPALQADGGDLEFVKLKDHIVYIKFKGACIGCPFSFYTLTMGIEQQLKEKVAEIKKVKVI